ncbi:MULTISPECIES: alpha-L-rhamnosidase C-terminal domain-containing protein [Streptomyces]|uniref:alpha-L-rhamnosidase C-terminal domain-containing protein n=1 Tax=Streptomyces TaxID=1883 RepID=UPI0015A6B895|nr:hypothetical protein [Streptomyces caniscabiei]MBE4760605.1 hypothetical protein [Streptomyces caniscabiei]MBE4774603.1 hypothetical protein [Streptomyces caniscabiei]MBE4788976.1 hypothetical protein [Streptomyces caniscabiei]MBE4798581.1 hypothetical protein [Streptomyces caniscabiei]
MHEPPSRSSPGIIPASPRSTRNRTAGRARPPAHRPTAAECGARRAATRHHTPYGPTAVSWRREDGRFRLHVDVPGGARCRARRWRAIVAAAVATGVTPTPSDHRRRSFSHGDLSGEPQGRFGDPGKAPFPAFRPVSAGWMAGVFVRPRAMKPEVRAGSERTRGARPRS